MAETERSSKIFQTFGKASEPLTQRYKECDSGGHKKLNQEGDYCDHCFRHTTYGTPRTDEILASRKDIPLIHQPMDASLMMKSTMDEIMNQEGLDAFEGLIKIAKELKL
ncbi:hypothetical protein GOV13_05555 [Candidatus Pacearchaeota archaeon]|nr:hypothetical protein [Candidatus Pacearchaeota archaeon]